MKADDGSQLREGVRMEKRILLVEDDASFGTVFAYAVRESLADEGLGVAFVEASTRAEARERLREGGLDAALIDVWMPDGTGWSSWRRSTTAAWAVPSRSWC